MSELPVDRWLHLMRLVIETPASDSTAPSGSALSTVLSAMSGAQGMAEADQVLEALDTGFEASNIASRILGLRPSFASLCVTHRRADVLRSALEHPHPSFTAEDGRPCAKWLSVLSCGDADVMGNPVDVFTLACRRLDAAALPFYELCIEVAPEHPGIRSVMEDDVVARVQIAELLMRRRLLVEALTRSTPDEALPTVALRRKL